MTSVEEDNILIGRLDDLRITLREIKADILQNRGERAVRLIDEVLARTEWYEKCVWCSSFDVNIVWKDEEIPVWPDNDPRHKIVTAHIPVHCCNNCHEMWTGHEAGAIRDKAVRESH